MTTMRDASRLARISRLLDKENTMQTSKRLTLALAVALLSTGAEAGQPWVFLQQSGADQIVSTGINGRNGIVGNAMTISPSTSSAFLRTPDGTMTAIAPPGATQS